jgi:hypothetical protein
VGKDTPSESESWGGDDKEEDEDEKEGEVIPPPCSLPHEDLPSLSDLFGWQARISIGARWSKRSRTETGSSTNSPPQSDLTLVSSD